MSGLDPWRWLREARRAMATLPHLRPMRVPDAPLLPVRDPWPGDAGRGARLLRGASDGHGPGPAAWSALGAEASGFSWLRDLRALGTDSARLRARALTSAFIAAHPADPLARRPDLAGARIAAWLGHYDFFAASAEDEFRQRLMTRLLADTRALARDLPAEDMGGRALTALKGLVAAGVALPEPLGFLGRALRFLPAEIGRQMLGDGCHVERSPAAQLRALQDLTEIRALLQGAQVLPPAALAPAIERLAVGLRTLRHGDGGLALFNGAGEGDPALIELVLAQAGRGGRPVATLFEGGFHRLQAGRGLVFLDGGKPAPAGIDRRAHAGTLAFEFSVGRERMIVNCGAAPPGGEWFDAARASAAHSTLVIADTSSAELSPGGLGRRPERVEVERQEASGAHWLAASHDGWWRIFGALHRRRLYLAESGEDLRGEDAVEAASPQPFVIRFHLHPSVTASLQQDGEGVLIRLPGGSFWRLRAEGVRIALDESVYLGGEAPRRAEQVVLTSGVDGPQLVKWAITKVG